MLVLVLIDVLMLGSVVVVVVSVDGAVVSVLVDGGGVVSVTVWVGATSDADSDVVVVEVVDSVLPDESSDIRLTASHTMSATRSAISAPKPISAAGLRYQGVGSARAAGPAAGSIAAVVAVVGRVGGGLTVRVVIRVIGSVSSHGHR